MQSSFCWVIQLFSLVCTVKGYYDREWERAGGWGCQGHTLLLGSRPLSLPHHRCPVFLTCILTLTPNDCA